MQLGTVWFLAGCGIAIIVSAFDHLPKWLPMTMFLTMGWMGALLALAIFKYVGVGGIALLAAGGVAFSAGGRCTMASRQIHFPGNSGSMRFGTSWSSSALCSTSSSCGSTSCPTSPLHEMNQ